MPAAAPKRTRLAHWLLWLVLAAAALYVAGFIAFAENLPRRPAKLDHPDAIVALTGGMNRLDAAVALFEGGVGKRLLISGVNTATSREQLKKAVHGGQRFDCCADLGFSAENTHGNAAEAATWARRHGYRRLLIVTSSYHMPRSLAEFAAEMPEIKLQPWPVEPDVLHDGGWWHDPHTLRLLDGEYNKYLASVLLTHLIPEKERDAIDPSLARGKASGAATAERS